MIEIIRRDYLLRPSPREVPYNLNHPDVKDPSAGQADLILPRLNNLVILVVYFRKFLKYSISFVFGGRRTDSSSNAGLLTVRLYPTLCTWSDFLIGLES